MMVRNSGLLALLALAATTLPLTAQIDDAEWQRRCEREWNDRSRESFCEVRVERLGARRELVVDGERNGGATVVGWDRAEIEVHARIHTQAEDLGDARALGQAVRLRLDDTISGDCPQTSRRESCTVSFIVYVPREMDIDLRAHNGPVGARDVSGRIVMETHNGPVSLRRVGGDVRARTRNGPVTVELTGTRWQGAGLTAETQNGPVTLYVPENYNAELETGTQNGSMNVDFPMQITVQGRNIGRSIRTTLGNGGPEIRVTTRNGPLRVSRPEG
jgi:hypothetical protein